MANFFTQFHFLRPLWLWVLIPMVLILWQLWSNKFRVSNWQKVCDEHLLKKLLVGQTKPQNKSPLTLLAIAWFFAGIAMAGPTWSQLPQPVYQNLTSSVIVIDTSLYMDASDVPPSRLTRAKYKALDILKNARDGRFGLIVFTAEPFIVAPLTQDANTISMLIPEIKTDILPVQGSNIALALEQAKLLLQQGGANEGDIFLLTASPVNQPDLNEAQKLKQEKYNVSVLAIGTAEGAPIPKPGGGFLKDQQGAIVLTRVDSKGLAQLAQAGGGRFSELTNDDNDVNYLLAPLLATNHAQHAKLTEETTAIWLDQGRWFLIITVLLSLAAFRRGWMEDVLR